jgi:hypothetical protein
VAAKRIAGYEDMLVCAQQCLVGYVGEGGYGCDNYACACKNFSPINQQVYFCISSSCPGDTSDIVTASSVFSVYCTPAAVAINTGMTATETGKVSAVTSESSTSSNTGRMG